MSLKLKFTLKIISNVLIGLAIVAAFLLQGVKLFGLTPYAVLSGSMESVYPTGSLIYIKDVDPETLEVGDVITFKMTNGSIATHRIVELVPDKEDPEIVRFRTKGDENNIADGTLTEGGDVIGQPLFGIPLLGYIATYIARLPGKYVAVAVAVVLILIEVIIGLLIDEKEKEPIAQSRH